MKAGKAIGVCASGLAGAAIAVLCSMLPRMFAGHDWLWVAVSLGGTGGLIVGYLLMTAHERSVGLEKCVDRGNAGQTKSSQDYQGFHEEHERDKKGFIETQALYEQVFNTMGSGVLVVDRNGDPLLVNRHAVSLLLLEDNLTRESLTGVLPYFDVLKDAAVSRNRSVARITLRDGTTRLFGFSVSPLGSGSRVFVFQDETVAAENQERKQRSEELALVGEMISRLSHEIRNPIASILVGVQTLSRDTPESSAHGHILQLIAEEVDSLLKIVTQLLESARPRTYSPSPVYVQPLLERCMDAHGFQATGRGVRLEMVRFPVATFVLVDDQSMLRALGSLIQNALDACQRGGLIRIGWRELDPSGKAELVPGFAGKVVSVFIEDSGAGVPGELMSSESRIFKAFVSTKDSGTGLGLAVAQDIVEAHGGVIVVSALDSGGTRVEILLPIPEGIPCWDWNGDHSADCTSCEVRSTGTGYHCWKHDQEDYPADARQWSERCLKCSFFRVSSLTPFFKSRLVVPKAE